MYCWCPCPNSQMHKILPISPYPRSSCWVPQVTPTFFKKSQMRHWLCRTQWNLVVGRSYGGMQPHSRHEHVKCPNAVVIHHDTGIQVLSFATGRPLTEIPLLGRTRSSTFADVNDDDEVDQVRSDFSLKCEADVASVLPRPRALFTGPLCESPFWWGGVAVSNLFQTVDVVNEDTHVAVPPAVVPR